MGRIAEILSFTHKLIGGVNTSDVKINPDGGSNITVPHFSAPGDDSVPLTTDSVVTTEIQGTGNEAAVGYVDSKNTPKALQGEKRIYSRDAGGAEVAEVWLKNDGTIVASNAGGSINLNPDGTLNINASTSVNVVAPAINFTGDVIVTGTLTTTTIAATSIITTGDVVAGGKSLTTHTHLAGTPPGFTGPPV